eukprot:365292-Chlamydomonas_euryale.AAC.6
MHACCASAAAAASSPPLALCPVWPGECGCVRAYAHFTLCDLLVTAPAGAAADRATAAATLGVKRSPSALVPEMAIAIASATPHFPTLWLLPTVWRADRDDALASATAL